MVFLVLFDRRFLKLLIQALSLLIILHLVTEHPVSTVGDQRGKIKLVETGIIPTTPPIQPDLRLVPD